MLRRKNDSGEPPQLPNAPFRLDTCTLAFKATREEQAAFDEHWQASKTSQEFWDGATQADWMLDVLRSEHLRVGVVPEAQLRWFALRCVEGLEGEKPAPLVELRQAVARRIVSTGTLQELSDAQQKAHAWVSAGGVQGIPRCIPVAAAALAAWHTASANPYQAAFWTAYFTACHDAFVVVQTEAASWTCPDDRGEPWRKSWHAAAFSIAHPEVFRKAVVESRRRQAELLRSILPNPFARWDAPLPGKVFARAEGENQNELTLYCDGCGVGLDGIGRLAIPDVREYYCSKCRRPLEMRLN